MGMAQQEASKMAGSRDQRGGESLRNCKVRCLGTIWSPCTSTRPRGGASFTDLRVTAGAPFMLLLDRCLFDLGNLCDWECLSYRPALARETHARSRAHSFQSETTRVQTNGFGFVKLQPLKLRTARLVRSFRCFMSKPLPLRTYGLNSLIRNSKPLGCTLVGLVRFRRVSVLPYLTAS